MGGVVGGQAQDEQSESTNVADNGFRRLRSFSLTFPLWEPDRNRITHLEQFRWDINNKYGLKLESYSDLHEWSVKEYPTFWAEVWQYCQIVHSEPPLRIVDPNVRIDEIPSWFEGAKLNYAENLLKYRDDHIALYFTAEGRNSVESYTYAELYKHVSQVCASLRAMGVRSGDTVAGYMPNCPEAVIAMLATAAIGATWTSTSPDFGVGGVLDRFCQVHPKVIFSVNAVVYNGKVHDHMSKLQSVIEGLSDDLEQVIVLAFHGTESKINIGSIPKGKLYSEFLLSGLNKDGSVPEMKFEQVPFSHPLFVMYSSGTTGAPKCMVHSVGGTLIKHLEEHVLQANMTRDDVMIYYTTTGWMMWNWLVTALAVGSTVVLYDGSPFLPTPHFMWDLVDELGITILGTGAKWIATCEERNVTPRITHKLTSLRAIFSTGSPLKPHSYDYVYRDVKEKIMLASISGGTDIIGCFMGVNTSLPVNRGEVQSFHLGCAMECWDHDGKPVVGQRGELVCTKPFPSMPTHFWNDSEGILYTKAYFTKFPGVWAHGDYCVINPQTGGIFMLGRSDGTLNPNGVRFGSAEIYNIVESFEEVEDSLCVGQRNSEGEERVILFLKLADDQALTPGLLQKLRIAIRNQLSARHIPAIITQTKEIPYTVSGKKVEVAVRQMIAGENVHNVGALANPQSLQNYRNLSILEGW